VSGVALALLAFAGMAGCDKTTKPEPVKYNLYVGARSWDTVVEGLYRNEIYVYDADSLTLIDSFPHIDYINQLVVSPDGRSLYIRGGPNMPLPAGLWKIDARTRQVVWSCTTEVKRNRRQFVQILGNGRMLLSGNEVRRPEDGSLVRRLDDSLITMFGPVPGTKAAAIIRQDPTSSMGYDSIIRVVDVATGEVSGRFVAYLASGVPLQQFYMARLHPDGRRVLAIGLYGSYDNTWFVIGDIETGQTLFRQKIYRPLGEIVISSDGNLAAFSDNGMSILGEGGVLRIIDLQTLPSIPLSPLALASQVRFLPGDRRVITAPPSGDATVRPMDVVDLATMALERSIRLPTTVAYSFGGLAVGPRP
jgi:WD40 repeat protein